MKTENLHTLVGACVISGVIALTIFWMRGDHTETLDDSYRLTATFSKVDGVDVGSQVLLAGIPVGAVIAENMDNQNHQVTLTMKIDQNIELPIDSVAKISSNGIFGAKYISIDVGGDFDVLEDGDAFEFIGDSVIFEEIFERVLQIGEAGYQKRKAEAEKNKDDKSSANIFATDPSLLGNALTSDDLENDDAVEDDLFADPFDADIFDDTESDETPNNNQPIKSDEGDGPV